jgi:hypothetical protein
MGVHHQVGELRVSVPADDFCSGQYNGGSWLLGPGGVAAVYGEGGEPPPI